METGEKDPNVNVYTICWIVSGRTVTYEIKNRKILINNKLHEVKLLKDNWTEVQVTIKEENTGQTNFMAGCL